MITIYFLHRILYIDRIDAKENVLQLIEIKSLYWLEVKKALEVNKKMQFKLIMKPF